MTDVAGVSTGCGRPSGRVLAVLRAADDPGVNRQQIPQGSPRSPQWFDPTHQADILAAFDSHLAAGMPDRSPFGPRPERVRELGHLAAASTMPARAALLRWGALPATVRGHLLTSWYGRQHQASNAA